MLRIQKWAAMAAGAALISSNAAQAADSVYMGECSRADIIQRESTIDKLIPHKRFEGVQRLHSGYLVTSACNSDQLQITTLTESKRTSSEIVYTVQRPAIDFGKKPGCTQPTAVATIATGTVKFTVARRTVGELCEIYLWAVWELRSAQDTNWKGDFSARAIALEGGSFVITQPASDGVSYRTPLAVTGVK
jgi:hypothetical protein